jgi:hypothetical protein
MGNRLFLGLRSGKKLSRLITAFNRKFNINVRKASVQWNVDSNTERAACQACSVPRENTENFGGDGR